MRIRHDLLHNWLSRWLLRYQFVGLGVCLLQYTQDRLRE